jgi:hypothetical protein
MITSEDENFAEFAEKPEKELKKSDANFITKLTIKGFLLNYASDELTIQLLVTKEPLYLKVIKMLKILTLKKEL